MSTLNGIHDLCILNYLSFIFHLFIFPVATIDLTSRTLRDLTMDAKISLEPPMTYENGHVHAYPARDHENGNSRPFHFHRLISGIIKFRGNSLVHVRTSPCSLFLRFAGVSNLRSLSA